jgi:hypothetical protein
MKKAEAASAPASEAQSHGPFSQKVFLGILVNLFVANDYVGTLRCHLHQENGKLLNLS